MTRQMSMTSSKRMKKRGENERKRKLGRVANPGKTKIVKRRRKHLAEDVVVQRGKKASPPMISMKTGSRRRRGVVKRSRSWTLPKQKILPINRCVYFICLFLFVS